MANETATSFRSSPYNFSDNPPQISRTLTICDATLREGQQASGVAFTIAEQVQIALALTRLGLRSLQVGYAGVDDVAMQAIRAACPDSRLAAMVIGWERDAEHKLRTAQAAGGDICAILMRGTPEHLRDLGLTASEATARATFIVESARRLGWPVVMVALTHTMMIDYQQLLGFYQATLEAGAQVISISDSQGKAGPRAVRNLVTRLRQDLGDVDIRIHMHNDYGLALANTLAGLEAGATWADVTVLGLGERTGNCAIEELAVALEGLYGFESGLDLTALTGTCALVAQLANVNIESRKPIVGSDCFINELEIHVHAAASNPSLMEPFDPALVGGKREIRLGRGTGASAVRLKLAELGLELPVDSFDDAARLIREKSLETKRPITDRQFAAIVRQLSRQSHGEQR